MSTRDHIARLAERHHGVISRAQLVRVGVTTAQLRTLLRDGTLIRVVGGVYRCAGSPRTYEQTVTAAVVAGGPGATVSHRCAARLLHLGVPWFAEAVPEITVRRGVRGHDARRLAIVHSARHLERSDITRRAGLPVTTPLRVAVDCAAIPDLDIDAYRALVDDVLFRFGTPKGLRDSWSRVGRRAGLLRLEDALAPYVPGAPAESPKEMSLARVCWEAGLPLPERQVTVIDPRNGAVVARCDLAYRDARVGLEYDGQRFHAARHGPGDRIRHDLLEVLDWKILHAGKADLVAPGSTRFVRAVARCLLERLPTEHATRASAERVLAQLSA